MKRLVLDIGCGNTPKGDVNCDLYRHETPHLMGDEKNQSFNKKIPNFVLCDVTYLPFCDNSFDIVNASQVLEHVLNPCLVLKEMRRCSKRIVTLDVPNLRRLTAEQNPFHIYSWSDKTLCSLLKNFFESVIIVGAEYGSYMPRKLLKKRGLGFFLEVIENLMYRIFGPPFIKAVCNVSKDED